MNLSHKWKYLQGVAKSRLRNNKTLYHVDRYGTDIEVLGAAGELAARRFLGLPEKLHLTRDNGIDLYWRGYKVDVKATHMTKYLHHRYLQWPHYKPVKAEIILMTAVDLRRKKATVIGFATAHEVNSAPINTSRDIPCHEIPMDALHPAWRMQVLQYRRSNE